MLLTLFIPTTVPGNLSNDSFDNFGQGVNEPPSCHALLFSMNGDVSKYGDKNVKSTVANHTQVKEMLLSTILSTETKWSSVANITQVKEMFLSPKTGRYKKGWEDPVIQEETKR